MPNEPFDMNSLGLCINIKKPTTLNVNINALIVFRVPHSTRNQTMGGFDSANSYIIFVPSCTNSPKYQIHSYYF